MTRGGPLLLLAVACALGCPKSTMTAAPVQAALVAKRSAAPIDVNARIASRTGSCAQVKSVQDKAAADAVADGIRKALNLPVDEVRADLGERGVWWRICVGDEESEARIVALATRWTASGGALEPFLDEAKDGSPRFFVLSRENAEKRHAPDAASKALGQWALEGGAPVILFGGPAQTELAVAGTAATDSGATDVVAASPSGAMLVVASKPAPGCAACELALKESPVIARRVLAAGDVDGRSAGDELLVEERTAKGVRLLSAFSAQGGALARAASLVLENARPGYASTGTAEVVEADLDPQKEIVLAQTDLLTDGDNACAVSRHAFVYDVGAAGLSRIDAMKLPATPADAVVNVITVLDAAGDHDGASHACAAQLSHEAQPATAQLCLQRVRRLLDAGAVVDAVNAAGLVAEAAPALRPLLAAPFQQAVAALDKDPRFFAGEDDSCKKSPLVTGLSTRPLDASAKLATEKAAARLALADVADAVFVTGERDFGKDSPVGAVIDKWLLQAKVALPARYAAVEALLLPPAPEAAP